MEISASELEFLFSVANGLWEVSHGDLDRTQKNTLMSRIDELMRESHQALMSSPEGKSLLSVVIAHVYKMETSRFSDSARAKVLEAKSKRLDNELHLLKASWADPEAVFAHYEELTAADAPEESVNGNLFLTIEYDGYITRHDFSRLLTRLDRFVEEEIVNFIVRASDARLTSDKVYAALKAVPNRSFIGIAAIDHGSIVVSALASPDVLKQIAAIGAIPLDYVGPPIKKGMDSSAFPGELDRLGKNIGTILASVVSKFNDWSEKRFKALIKESSIRAKAQVDGSKKKLRARKPKSKEPVNKPGTA